VPSSSIGLIPPGNLVLGTSQVASGRLGLLWDDGTGNGLTLSDGTILFALDFTVVGNAGAQTPITFGDVPTPRQVIQNVGGTLTDVTPSSIFNAGSVEVTAVPEPSNAAFGVLALCAIGSRVYLRARQSSQRHV